MDPSNKHSLSHIDRDGAVRMVDVSDKNVTVRTAVATAEITLRSDVIEQLVSGTLQKGEAIAAAKIAGIQAAKKTGELIPLCHPLPLDCVDVEIRTLSDSRIEVRATAKTSGKTGVEMEALTAATVAALTLYDMTKAIDKSAVIGPIQLVEKSGGKSGTFRRNVESTGA
jgi:cyclic pyranopterin monophosphate synthase